MDFRAHFPVHRKGHPSVNYFVFCHDHQESELEGDGWIDDDFDDFEDDDWEDDEEEEDDDAPKSKRK